MAYTQKNWPKWLGGKGKKTKTRKHKVSTRGGAFGRKRRSRFLAALTFWNPRD